jgi:F0F1-type ATP synthase membrane subunit c/vacuolar-type H+-ATPase subunit K
MEENTNVEQKYRAITVVWFALLISQLMFLVILFFVKPEIFKFDFSKSPLGDNPAIVIALAVLGVSTFLMSFVLSRKFINQAISQQKTTLVQTALIIGCALCEATTLFGFVLVFIANYQFFFLWFALGILGMILHFPKRDNLIAASCKGISNNATEI